MIYLEIHSLRDSFRYRRSEWAMAAILAFGWGMMLLLPMQTFNTAAGFSAMKEWASEETWGRVCLVLGLTRLAVLYVNGRWRRCSHARMIIAALSGFVWATIALGLFRSGVFAPGLITYPAFFLMDLHIVYEAAADARIADEKHRAGTGRPPIHA